jgi:luciferase family oxidoreductase group 1
MQTSEMQVIPFSVLDLSPINQGSDAAHAFRNSLDLAQHAERWNYKRFWLAEHHNMPGIASAATAVVIGYIAGGTRTIRVGSGGVMLPNHAPLVIAEQFGTLESLYEGRIDLGLGRAPGTDQFTARALRRDFAASAENFPRDVMELQALLGPVQPNQMVRAVPGAGLRVPIWLLGSSTFSATRCHARLAVCVRVAFCPCGADAGAESIPHFVSAVGAASRALRDGGREYFRSRYGCRGGESHHIAATAVRQPAPRHARTFAAGGRQHG